MAVPLASCKATMTISAEERTFFIALGERIATMRREHGVTQVQLAEALGVSQQTMQSYEVGRRRIPVSAMPLVAHTLSVSLEELFGEEAKAPSGKPGPTPRLQQRLERLSQLPRPQQRLVMDMLDAALGQSGR